MARIELIGNAVGIEEIGTWDGAIHFRMTFPPFRVADLDGLVSMMTLPGHDEPMRVTVFENSVARVTAPFGGLVAAPARGNALAIDDAVVERVRWLR